jgi:SGNH domain (fused to AT3 domains)
VLRHAHTVKLAKVAAMMVALVVAATSPAGAQARTLSGREAATSAPVGPLASTARVLAAVQAAQGLNAVPKDIQPPLTESGDWAAAGGNDTSCNMGLKDKAGVPFYAFGGCTYGYLSSNKLMVIYGDSHAGMWGEALQAVALRTGWRLLTYYLPNCPAPDLNFLSWSNGKPNTQCNEFHGLGPAAIERLHPQLVVLTSNAGPVQVGKGVLPTAAQWEAGWIRVINTFRHKGTSIVMIGDIPQWGTDSSTCLKQHMTAVQDCAALPGESLAANVSAEKAAATAEHIRYISPARWICSSKCEPIIGGLRVYNDQWDLTGDFVSYVSGALGQAIGLLPKASH